MSDAAPETTPNPETTDLGWRAALPEELRELPFIAKAPNIEKVVHDLKDAAQHMGNSLRIPSENASDEDKQRFTQRILEKMPNLTLVPSEDDDESYAKVLQALGAPDDPKLYKVPEIEGLDWDEDFTNALQAKAKAAGLTKKQFKQWATDIGTQMRDEQLTQQTQHTEQLGVLQKEWGAAFEPRVKQLARFLEDSDAPNGLVQAVANKQVPPETFKWLHGLYQKMNPKEGNNASTDGYSEGEQAITPDEAQMQIQEILRNPAYFNASDPMQKLLIKKMLKLQELAHPKKR